MLGDFLDRTWPQTSNQYDNYWRKREKTERTGLLEHMKRLLEDKEFTRHADFHNLYEVLLYLTPFSSLAKDIYSEYQNQFKNIEMLERVARECKSNILKSTIHKMGVI